MAVVTFDWKRYRKAGLDRPSHSNVFMNPYPMIRLQSTKEELEELRAAYAHIRREHERLKASIELREAYKVFADIEPVPEVAKLASDASPVVDTTEVCTDAMALAMMDRLEFLETKLSELRSALDRQQEELETLKTAQVGHLAEIDRLRAEIDTVRRNASGNATSRATMAAPNIPNGKSADADSRSFLTTAAAPSFSDRMKALEVSLSELEALYVMDHKDDFSEKAIETTVTPQPPEPYEEKATDFVRLTQSVAGWVFPAPSEAQIRLVRDALRGCGFSASGEGEKPAQ